MLILGIILFGMVVGAAAQWLLGGSASRVNWGLALVAGLVGVPGLPRGYVAREELAGLIAAVVSADTGGGAVGVTGQVSPVGLYGQGGIGKSVLAVALARDEDIRSRFPDGIYWVSVGEHADVLAAQLGLLDRLDC